MRDLHHDRNILILAKDVMDTTKYKLLEKRLQIKSWVLTGFIKYEFQYDDLEKVVHK